MGETTFSPSFAFHCPTNPQMTPLINPNRRIGMRFIRNLFCYCFVTHFRIFIFRLPVQGISGFPIPKSQRQLLPVWRQKGMNEIFFWSKPATCSAPLFANRCKNGPSINQKDMQGGLRVGACSLTQTQMWLVWVVGLWRWGRGPGEEKGGWVGLGLGGWYDCKSWEEQRGTHRFVTDWTSLHQADAKLPILPKCCLLALPCADQVCIHTMFAMQAMHGQTVEDPSTQSRSFSLILFHQGPLLVSRGVGQIKYPFRYM